MRLGGCIFFIELGVVDAEDFIEVGTGSVHLGQVQVIDHDCEGKLAKVVPVQLNLLDPSPSSRTWLSLESSSNTSCGAASFMLTWLTNERLVL